MSKKRNPSPQAPAKKDEFAVPYDDTELRHRIFKETYDELVKKQISNSENFDRSILTLSTSGLGISLAFLKDFVPLATAQVKLSLLLSWALFAIAIISTIGSFITSQEAIKKQIDFAHKYYLDKKEEFLGKINPWSSATNRLNIAAGTSFILAVSLTIFFAVYNLNLK